MGDTTAMIDTGAKRSAIALDLIKDRNSFPIKESMSNWRLADGEPARGVCGEISMTVSYRGHIIELPRVVVMRRQSAPFILGIEWIYAMRALVGTQDKKGVVILPEDKSILSDWTKQNEEKLVESSNSPGILLAQERKVGIEEHFSDRIDFNVPMEGPSRDWQLFRAKVRSRTVYARTPQYIKLFLMAEPSSLVEEKKRVGKNENGILTRDLARLTLKSRQKYSRHMTKMGILSVVSKL